MPPTRLHNEWLSLIEVSGPFLSVPVLERVLPQGLDAHDPDHVRVLKLAFEEWEDDQQGERANPAIHREWIRFVLKQSLGLPDEVIVEGQAIPQTLRATMALEGETLRPDLCVLNLDGGSDAGKIRLLIQVYPPTQNLQKPLHGRSWNASPATRMMELLHATGNRLGLVTNGEEWMLVDAPKGETTGFSSWFASLWFEEPLTLRAFRTLLGVHRFFAVPDDETLEAMLKESASNQQEVTDRLGYQVREAVEEIVRSLDRLDQDEKRELLAGLPESELYEAALTVMMRLVFLFSAEERGLLLLGDPLYDEHYAVSTLVAKLQEAADQHGEEVLERRHDAWVRLLSTFRAVYGGVRHERMKLLPYAGKLFDPDRFPILEGRKSGTTWKNAPATPLRLDNRTVLHLLRSLQYLEMRGEARRLSFRALDIEQIGHVYEGLLDHTARRATGPMVSLTAAKGDEPEVAVWELEGLLAKGEATLIKFLKDQTGRSETALAKSLKNPSDGEPLRKLRAACGDEALFNRIRPFSGLVRNDTFDRPVVIRQGSVFVTAGTDRRSSGTHYTPRSLTEPIVRYTLESLVYVGPAEGKPENEWNLRSAKDLLDLKICDMACGSGAFLVQACRYLADRLVEAWEDLERKGVPGQQGDLFKASESNPRYRPRITPYGMLSEGNLLDEFVPLDDDERRSLARRLVAQRCLYGVDKNPLAVEMAKLSIWLLTLAKDKPFTFLDHAIRPGDSLVGVSDTDQLMTFSLDRQGTATLDRIIIKKLDHVKLMRDQLTRLPEKDAADVERKRLMFANIQDQSKRLTFAADLLLAASWKPTRADEREQRLKDALFEVEYQFRDKDANELEAQAAEVRRQASLPVPFHWPLEFPEVFIDRGGFDAFVGNPPFMGGHKITGNLGTEFRDYLVERVARGKRGHADFCAYFFLRIEDLLRQGGQAGLLATNTIAQGDTREVGLDQLTANGCAIPRAIRSQKWPGTANLEVALVWLRKGQWASPFFLDDIPTSGINSLLTACGEAGGLPKRLVAKANTSYNGVKAYGQGFVLEPEEAMQLIDRNPKNKNALFPYLNGEDLNSNPDQTPSRWAISFFDWPLDRNSSPDGYEGPTAADYPDCLKIIEERVKPERTRRDEKGEYVLRKPMPQLWWIYGEKRPGLYRTIEGMDRVLVKSLTSKHHGFAFVPTGVLYDQTTLVFSFNTWSFFGVVQSEAHYQWSLQYGASLENRPRYSLTDCFETFPFPDDESLIVTPGKVYYTVRGEIMLTRQEGLTKTYNRFHNPDESAADIQKLRDLHVKMDRAVADAYGWSDLDLGHGFHETKQGTRYTISESARREVLARLLKLNHERHAEEVRQGLHSKKGKAPRGGRGSKPKPPPDEPGLFGDDA